MRTTLTSYGIRKDLQALLAALRTDLDSFSNVEAFALMTSGYRMMEKVLEASLSTVADPEPAPASWRFLQIEKDLRAQDVEPIKKVLEIGARREFKAWALLPGLRVATIIVFIFAALLLVLGLWPKQLDEFLPVALQKLGPAALIASRVAVIAIALFAFVLALLPLRRVRVLTWRVFKSCGLLLTALIARLYLLLIEPWFLKAGGLPSERN